MTAESIKMIMSGGQTGVDRAALDFGLSIGLPTGGFCPAGRKAEDGRIPDKYPLEELASPAYADRTRENATQSDATLILSPLPLFGGTAFTETCARKGYKPVLILDLEGEWEEEKKKWKNWLAAHDIEVLNIAGPRESSVQGIYRQALALLRVLWGK